MSMEINGSRPDGLRAYTERLKEDRSPDRADKTADAESTTTDRLPVPQDEYISSEKTGVKPGGLYRLGQDEEGNRKIFYENPKKAHNADRKPHPGTNADSPEKRSSASAPEAASEEPEKIVGNTDRVDREVRKLKEKKRQLEQQLHSVSGDEEKTRELEKKLAQVESELSQKDNDAYRRQHTIFSSTSFDK